MNFKLKTTVLSVISMGVLAGAMFASAQTQITAYQCANGSIVTDPNACVVSTPSTPATCFNFTRNLSVGNTGADVKALQQVLNSKGFAVAAAGQAGSAGFETTYFGNATKAALIKWQEANAATTLAPWGLTSGTGFFGATSRAEMNKCAPGTPTTPGIPPVSGAVSVSLASVQPNNVLVAGQAHAKLADFVFSGTGVVTNVKLQKTGISNFDSLVNVYLYDGNTKISDGVSVMNDGSINFNNGIGLFSITGSKTVSVYADIALGTGGQSVGVALTGFTLAGSAQAVVSGLNGPALPVGTADLATVSVATTSNQNQANMGDQNISIWSATVNVALHDVYLVGGSFMMNGTAQHSAISNVKLYIDGVQVGNATSPDASGRISFNTSNHFVRSGSHNVQVRADVVGEAGRDFEISLENISDLLFEDAQLRGAYVTPTANVNYNLKGDKLTIGSCSGSGCTTISSDSAFTGNVAKVVAGASSQTIGKMKLTVSGEPVQLMSASLKVNSDKTNTNKLTNVSLYINGQLINSGAVAELGTSSSSITLQNLGGIIVNPGQSVVIEVKADLRNTNGSNITNGQDLTVKLSNLQVKGTISRNIVSTSNGQSLSAKVGNFTAALAKNDAFSVSKVSPDAQEVKIASFVMSADSSEGVTVTGLDLGLLGTGTPTFNRNQITTLLVKSSAGQEWSRSVGSGFSIATTTISLWDQVPANSSITYDVYATFNNATGTLTTTAKAYFTGQSSNTVASSTASGHYAITFEKSSLDSIKIASESDGDKYVTGGSTANTVFMISSSNNAKLNTVEIKVETPALVSKVTVAGQQASSLGNGKYQVSLNNPITLVSGFGTSVPVEVTFNQPNKDNNLSNASTTISITYLGADQGVSAGNEGVYGDPVTINSVVATSSKFVAAIGIPTEVKVIDGSSVAKGTNTFLGNIVVNTKGSIEIKAINFTAAVGGDQITDLTLKKGNTTMATSTMNDLVSGSVTYSVYGNTSSLTAGGVASISLGGVSTFVWSDSVKDNFNGEYIEKWNVK